MCKWSYMFGIKSFLINLLVFLMLASRWDWVAFILPV